MATTAKEVQGSTIWAPSPVETGEVSAAIRVVVRDNDSNQSVSITITDGEHTAGMWLPLEKWRELIA